MGFFGYAKPNDSFVQSGTKVEGYVSVEEFNRFNGESNDSQRIQRAVSEAASKKKGLLFSSKIYTVSEGTVYDLSKIPYVKAEGATLEDVRFKTSTGLIWDGGHIKQVHGMTNTSVFSLNNNSDGTFIHNLKITHNISFGGVKIYNTSNVVLSSHKTVGMGASPIIMGGSNITYSNCIFINNTTDRRKRDDCISIKSTVAPTENVMVTNCTSIGNANLVAIGTEITYPVNSITISNCTVKNCIFPIYIKPGSNNFPRGYVKNINISNIIIYDENGTSTSGVVKITPTNGAVIENIKIKDIAFEGRFYNENERIFISAVTFGESTIDGLQVKGCKYKDTYRGLPNSESEKGEPAITGIRLNVSEVGGTIKNVNIDDIILEGLKNNAEVINTNGEIKNLSYTNIRYLKDGGTWQGEGVIQQSHFLGVEGKQHKVVAGMLRNDETIGWSWVKNNTHDNLNMSFETVKTGSDHIYFKFNFSGAKVISLVATPDETFQSQGVFVGSSVSVNSVTLKMSRMENDISGQLTWDSLAKTWSIANNNGISTANWNDASKCLTIKHSYCNNGLITHSPRDQYVGIYNDGYTNTSTIIKFDTSDGYPPNGFRFQFGRAGGMTKNIDPKLLTDTSGNIWVQGIIEV